MTENQSIQKVDQSDIVPGRKIGLAEIMFDLQKFEQVKQIANVFYNSALVPSAIRGKSPGEGIANIILAFSLASEMQENPLILMQNVFFVGGTPGWKTQYMIAKANRSKIFAGRINWRTTNPNGNLTVTAYAKLAGTGEDVEVSVDMAMAKAEDWTRNAKYKSMPEHMLRWRAAAFLIRLYAPEIMLGYSTVEELETMRSIPSAGADAKVNDLLGALGLPAPGQVIDAEEGAPFDEEIPPPDDDPKPPMPPGGGAPPPAPKSGPDLAKLQSMAPTLRAKEEPLKAPPAPASQVVEVPKVVELLGPQGPATAAQQSAMERTEDRPDLHLWTTDEAAALQAQISREMQEINAALARAGAAEMEKTKIQTWADHLDHFHSRGDSARLATELEKFRGVIEKKEAEQKALAAYAKPVQQPEPPSPPRAILIINAAEQRGVISKDEAQSFRAAYAGAPDADAAAEEEDAILEALAEKEGGILLEAGRRAGLVSPQPKREWLKAAPKIEGGAWDRGIKFLIGKGLAVKHGTGSGSKYSVVPASLAERATLSEVPKFPVPASFQPGETPIERANAWTAAIISSAYVKALIDDDRAQELEQAAREAYDDRQLDSILAIAQGLKARAAERGIVLE